MLARKNHRTLANPCVVNSVPAINGAITTPTIFSTIVCYSAMFNNFPVAGVLTAFK